VQTSMKRSGEYDASRNVRFPRQFTDLLIQGYPIFMGFTGLAAVTAKGGKAPF